MLHLTIDGQSVDVPSGRTILEAALAAGIDIPRLCHDPRLEANGGCRLCQVHPAGIDSEPVPACCTAAADDMNIFTESAELSARRKALLELLLSDHRMACQTCDADGDCNLQDLAYRYDADEWTYGTFQHREPAAENYTSDNRGIAYDVEKCIRCARCVRFCEEVQGNCALALDARGFGVKVNTAHGRPLHESDCELCGGCIRVCPTGAMREKAARGLGRAKDLVKTVTTCTYCGVGCTLELNVNPRLNRAVRVTTRPEIGINDGNLCVKGHFALDFISRPDRLRMPLIREQDGKFREASWDEAIELVGRRLGEIRDRHGPDGLAFISSCRCSNEENYLMQKLARCAGGTNNIDQCATTCHAPTVAGLAAAFGSGAMTNSIAEIRDAHTLFLIGSNPTEAHPIIGLEMKKALNKGARLVVCDPRDTWMAQRADIHIKHRPGTDNLLINAMMSHIVTQGLHNQSFIAERCENTDAILANLEGCDIEAAAQGCGVRADDIRRAAEFYAAGAPSSIFYTLGITEHTSGTDNVKNLANLAMLCGQIGKRSSGVNPLRGQNNVQGGCDMGAMYYALPGYQKVDDPEVRRKFEQAWGRPLPPNRGGRIPDYVTQAGAGVLKGLYCVGEDLARSEANSARVIHDLKQLEFLVTQDIFMSEISKLAHVVLPAACYAEKDGTFTNTERRVQRIRKALDPPGKAWPDWQIIAAVSTGMGYVMDYGHPSEIWDELAALTPSMAGISYPRIDKLGLQWPCPDAGHAGTPFLHKDRFVRGKGWFHPIVHRPPAEEPDAEYPLILSTGRTLYHYNVGGMTRPTGIISQKQDANFVEIHRETAARHGIRPDDTIRIRSRRGQILARAVVADRVRPDSIWMPFHFAESSANILTNDRFDNETSTAEYKCCAAAIEKVESPVP